MNFAFLVLITARDNRLAFAITVSSFVFTARILSVAEYLGFVVQLAVFEEVALLNRAYRYRRER